jgi:hypothetical protein
MRKKSLEFSAAVAAPLNKAEFEAIAVLGKTWVEHLEMPCPTDSWLRGLLRQAGAENALSAIETAGRKVRWGRKNSEPLNSESARNYTAAIARSASRQVPPARQK